MSASATWRFIGHPVVQTLAALLASAALCVLLAPWFMHNLDGPLDWHPDEWSKARQLQRDQRNFLHPQLMLETARIVAEWNQTPRTVMALTEVGRQTSAWFAAGAGAMLALAGFAVGRWRGWLLLGASSALSPALFAHAQFFKEDAALAFGTATVVCAGATLCAARRSKRFVWTFPAAAFLGAALGVAASAKYAGVAFVVPALLLVIVAAARRKRWWWGVPICLLLLAATAVPTWSGINWRAIEQWEEFREGFDSEVEHGLTSHRDVTLAKPTGYFLDAVWTDAMPHVRACAISCTALAPIVFVHRRRWARHRPASTLFGAWLLFTAGSVLLAISYSSIPFFRYALPVALMLCAIAGTGVLFLSDIAGAWRRWANWGVVTIGTILFVVVQSRRCADYAWQIEHDSRARLAAWVNATLPRGTFIVADGYTQLEGNNGWRSPWGERPPVQTHANVWRGTNAADFGPRDRLRRRGVKYVAIAGTNYERYVSPHAVAAPGEEDDFKKRSTFYRELFARYPIAWQAVAEHPMQTFANPNVVVFRVDGR